MFDNAGTVTLHEKEVQSIMIGDTVLYQKSNANTPVYTVQIVFDDESMAPPGVPITLDDGSTIMISGMDGWCASLPPGTTKITCPAPLNYGTARVIQEGYNITVLYQLSSKLGSQVTYTIQEAD